MGWGRSHESSVSPSSYLSGSASSPFFTSSSPIYIPSTNTLQDPCILSTIMGRTENPSSHLTSYKFSVPILDSGCGPVSDAIKCFTKLLHSQGVTDPASSTNTSSCHTGNLIMFIEDKSLSSGSSSCCFSPYGHQQIGPVPAGPRSLSPQTS